MTPTTNRDIPHNLGEFFCIADALDYAAAGETGVNFYSTRGVLDEVVSYRELRSRAFDIARRLIGAGLERGQTIALVAETSSEFLAAFYGCQYAGIVPCPMPHTNYLGGKDAYIARISGLLRAGGIRWIVTPAGLHEPVAAAAAAADARAISYDALATGRAIECVSPFGPDEVAYIQYSSGSTSSPKGILISQRAVSANARACVHFGMQLRFDDRAFSWLPLYHDMGLVGFSIAPMYGQCSVDYLSASAFARRPHLWLKLMSENRSTITYAPTLGYRLAAQRFNETDAIDLSKLRIAGVGGDMVRADVLHQFAERLEKTGFRASSFLPSYGMAEATLAISFSPAGLGLEVDAIDRAAADQSGMAVPLSGEKSSEARRFVVCGRPIPGHEVLIVDDAGATCAERMIGHIRIRGPSLMQGYINDPASTARVMHADGFMDTGDLGYRIGERIVVTGRAKDLILHGGRNVWPEDLEWTAERVEPLGQGDAAAFSVDGRDYDEIVVVLVQCGLTNEADRQGLCGRVSAAISAAFGISANVKLVPPRSLPFTSSGKLARARAKALYLSGAITVLDSSGR